MHDQGHRYEASLQKHIPTHSPFACILAQRQTHKTTLVTAPFEFKFLDWKKKIQFVLWIIFYSQHAIGDLHDSKTTELQIKTVLLRQVQCSYDMFHEQRQVFGQIGVLEDLQNTENQKLQSYWFSSYVPASSKEIILSEKFCEFFYHMDRSKAFTIGVMGRELLSILELTH